MTSFPSDRAATGGQQRVTQALVVAGGSSATAPSMLPTANRPSALATQGGNAAPATPSPWLTADEAAGYLRTSAKTVYRLAKQGYLRHAKIGGRRELRFRADWLDEHLLATSEPVEVRR